MTVFANATHEQVDTACCNDLGLVCCALCCEILCVSVEDVDVLLRNVNVVEEVSCHERVVTFRMLLRESYILVHVECDDVLE